jgi:hypothetical protein
MVTNDHVYKINANGCSSIKMPSVMKPHAISSMGPLRNHLGSELVVGFVAFVFSEMSMSNMQNLLLYLRTAPKVIPRNKCLRISTVNTNIGTKNNVVPAATAGQS